MRGFSNLVLALTLLLQNASGTFSGRVQLSDTLIQATDVTYSFILNFSKQIPVDGRLVIRFPQDYLTPFTVSSCDPESGLSTGTTQTMVCDYQSTTRMLTLTGVFPTTARQIQLSVQGVTNPQAAVQTGSFQVSSYSQIQGGYQLMEAGGNSITATMTTGSLQAQSLTLSNPTVGILSVLTLQFAPSHTIPQDGIIELTLPKWNQFNPIETYESMIAVAASPGNVECLPQLGLISQQTSCLFTEGETTDLLQIFLAEAADVAKDTVVSMLIQGVRAPPSQQPVTGFTLETTDQAGTPIDTVVDPTDITLTATQPMPSSSYSASVTAQPVVINTISNVTLAVQNANPLREGATVRIQVPDDFDMDRGPVTVTTAGINLELDPIINFEPSTRTLVIQKFNLEYLESLTFSYFYIYGMGNPGQTHRTDSFQISFLDPYLQEIEYIDNGVTFQAIVNGFESVALQATSPFINEENVGYKFTLLPMDSFNSSGIIKLYFPNELWVRQGAYLSQVSSNMKVGAKVTVNYNHVVIIENGFPSGYTQGDYIEFTLNGVRNPPTTDRTAGITLKIFYEEVSSEINDYSGDELTFKAEPSDQVSVSVELTQEMTGETQTNFTVVGNTPVDMVIAKGSWLKVFIPKQFLISDPQRVESSCTAVQGFSDEILCSFESVSLTGGATLIVRQGFESKAFNGGDFSFSLSEIKNPFTTKTTDAFGISVYDRNGNTLYEQSEKSETVAVRASDFAFSFIQSTSETNGASSMYNFSITFSVDTPVGANLQVQLPDEIEFDTSKPFSCIGTNGFSAQMQCFYRNGRSIWITLVSDDTFATYFNNGTTIGFQLGYMFNPVSLERSSSFRLSTYEIETGFTTKYNYINRRSSGLQIKNTQRGQIQIWNITQEGQNSNELGAQTQILFNFTTANRIPQGSKLIIIFPTNFVINGSPNMNVNGLPVAGISLNRETHTLSCTIQQDDLRDFLVLISSGFQNPQTGPYSYSQFNLEFETQSGYGIDQAISTETWIDVECSSGCQLCTQSLDNCEGCGTSNGEAYYLHEGQCLEECPAGQFGGPGYQCFPCEAPCLECQFASDLCTRCDPEGSKPYTNLVSLSCYTECPSGTYVDEATQQCLACESPCYTCTSATECLTCDAADPSNTAVFYFQKQKTCLDECPDVSVPSPAQVCVDCESPCLTCTDIPDKCTSCEEGLYLFKSLCVEGCPWQYYRDDTAMECKGVASLDIPMPFSITMIVISIGVAISSCMKHNGQGSTAFFVTCLAICDIMLRVNWFVLLVLALAQNQFITFYGCTTLLAVSMAINFLLWRRFFKYKYNMDENDKAFTTYCKNYPRTSTFIIFFSYWITFQSIRLSYSRLFGKKQFMASFTRQKRYYRLIGQLSIIEIFFVYLPGIALMFYSFWFEFVPGQQLFYIAIDSLFLVTYATVLIIVTLTQREQVMQPRELFQWSEICRCQVASDEEDMYDQEEDQNRALGSRSRSRNFQSRNRHKVMGAATLESDGITEEDSDQIDQAGRLEIQRQRKELQMEGQRVRAADAAEVEQETQSAADFEQIKTKKHNLYQKEYRLKVSDQNQAQPEDMAVTLIDYNEYRNIQEKIDRIKLKASLYENRRDNDYNRVQALSGHLSAGTTDKESLKKQIIRLQQDLCNVQVLIDNETNLMDTSVNQVIARKRDEIAKRSVESNQPRNFTLNSYREGSIESPRNNLFHFDQNRFGVGTDVKDNTNSSGYHNSNAMHSSLEKKNKTSTKKQKQTIGRESFGLNSDRT